MVPTDYLFHPLAEFFPPMPEEDLQALAKDIKENGQIQPILLLNDQILDGCNRYKACQIAGVEPITKPYTGKTDEESLIKFVASSNLNRRQLDSSQRAVLAVKLLPMLEKAAKERQRTAGGNHGNQYTSPTGLAVVQKVEQAVTTAPTESPKPEQTAGTRPVETEPKAEGKRSIEQAAELTGTNKQYVAYAKEIQEKRPEIMGDIMDKKTTITKAIKEIRSAEESREPSRGSKESVPVLQITFPKKASSKQDLLDLIQKINECPDISESIPVQFATGKSFNFEISKSSL